MISVSQALQGLTVATSFPTVQLSRTALIAAALPTDSDPGVQLTGGTATQDFPLYTPTGTLSVSANEGADLPEGVLAPTPATLVGLISLNGSAPGAPSVIAAATSASRSIPVAAGNTETAGTPLAPSVANSLTTNIFVHPAVKALTDFTANPVHGNLATALFINAAIYRSRPISSATLVSAIEQPEPVASLDAISVDIADLNDQSSGRQNQSTRSFSSDA